MTAVLALHPAERVTLDQQAEAEQVRRTLDSPHWSEFFNYFAVRADEQKPTDVQIALSLCKHLGPGMVEQVKFAHAAITARVISDLQDQGTTYPEMAQLATQLGYYLQASGFQYRGGEWVAKERRK